MKDNVEVAKEYTDWHIKHRGFARDMTMRDYFAGLAMPMAWDYSRRIDTGSRSNKEDKNECRYDLLVDPEEGDDDCEFVASVAYRLADAMLKERSK
jgi:hypothetical protein